MTKVVIAVLLVSVCLMLASCGDSESRKTAYFLKGKELFEAGDDARARLELKNTLQIDNRYAEAWYLLGRVEQRSGELRRAYQHYTRALELAPELVAARVSKAQLLIMANELELAEEAIQAALAIAPGDVNALVARGALRQRQGDRAGAGADAHAALAIEANHAGAAALLASIQLHDDEPTAELVRVLQDAIEANPEIPNLRLMLAQVYERQGNSAGVLKVLKGLTERFPQNSGYRFRLASYLVKLERNEEAEAILREALSQAPTDVERQRAFLEFLLRTKGLAATKAELDRILQLQDNAIELRFLEADLLRMAGDDESAESAYREIIRDLQAGEPNTIRASNGLARLLIDNNRESEAANLIESMLKNSPGDPDVLQLRAELALRNKDAAQAIADVRSVLDDYPDNYEAYVLLGTAQMQREEDTLAQDAFKQAIRLAPNEPSAYLALAELRVRVGDNQGALTILELLLEQAPDNVVAQREIARIQLSQQDWYALAQTAERIKAGRPDHPLGYYLTGLVRQRHGKHGEAVLLFERALELNSDGIESLLAMARSQLSLGATAEARRAIDRVLKQFPNNLTALTLLGEIYSSTGAVEKAAEIFEEAVRFHPRSPRAYVRLTQLRVTQGELDAARSTLLRGIEATGRNGYLVLQLAMLLDDVGERDAAVRTYEGLLEEYPDALIVVNNLAALLASEPNDQAALDYALELALRMKESEIPEFVDTLGWVHYQRGEYVHALPYFEKAVASQPEQLEMRYHLGMAYSKLGRIEQAKKNLRLAASADNFGFQQEARRMLEKLEEGSKPSRRSVPMS